MLRTLILIVLVVAIAAWIRGLIWFADTVPEKIADTTMHTDAIVVLTGGHGRIEEGVALLREGMAKKLFISGVEERLDVADVLKSLHIPPDSTDSAIMLGHMADSTASNAAETSDWMHAQNFKSMRLVTSAYHMPRSLLEFRHAVPDLKIIPHPVFPDAVKQDRWWAWPGTAQLIAVEYVKYLVADASLKLVGDEEPR
ncbi:MAG TPA: YdcF family protein [Magnetospirillaceae bacterium]